MNRLRATVLSLLLLLAVTGCSLSSLGIGEGEEVAVISGAPVVELTAPLANSTFLKGVVVNILASVSNAGQDLQRVEFKINEMTIADVASPNPAGSPRFSVTRTWTAETAGDYTVTVTAYRSDGTASQPATVQINVVDGLEEPTATEEAEPTSTPTVEAPTNAPAATSEVMAPIVERSTTEEAAAPGNNRTADTDEAPAVNVEAAATEEAAAPVSDDVVVRVVRGGMNVRRGPSTNFVPPVGVLVGETDVPILARNQDSSWYKITFQGADAWISSAANLVTLVSGDPSSLPVESGPPIPTLAPPTAVPPTTAPALPAATLAPGTTPGATTAPPAGGSGPNLVVTGFELRQGTRNINDIFINEPATALIKVKNVGNQPVSSGFFAVLKIVNKTDGGFLLEEAAIVPSLDAGAETIVSVPFTDKAGAGLVKSAAAFVDLNNQIPESNEQDNASTFAIEYVLGAQ